MDEARAQADLRQGDPGYIVYEQLSGPAQAARRQSLNLEMAERNKTNRANAKKATKAAEKEAARVKAAVSGNIPGHSPFKSPNSAKRPSKVMHDSSVVPAPAPSKDVNIPRSPSNGEASDTQQ